MRVVEIDTEFIKLDQFLKWAGISDSGSEAKSLVLAGKVKVNGVQELQRGKKLRKGDIVEVSGETFQIG